MPPYNLLKQCHLLVTKVQICETMKDISHSKITVYSPPPIGSWSCQSTKWAQSNFKILHSFHSINSIYKLKIKTNKKIIYFQHTMAQNIHYCSKMEEWGPMRKYQTKERPKPRRANTESCSSMSRVEGFTEFRQVILSSFATYNIHPSLGLVPTPMACSAHSLTQPRATCIPRSGSAHSELTPCSINYQSRNGPQTCLQGDLLEAFPQLKVLLPRYIQGCVNLTETSQPRSLLVLLNYQMSLLTPVLATKSPAGSYFGRLWNL